MLIEALAHSLSDAWSAPLPVHLDSPNTLVLAFGASEYAAQPQALDELRAAFPRALHLGCSTAGEIHGRQLQDRTLSVAVCKFERTELRLARAEVTPSQNSRAAGESLARELGRDDLRGVFVLSDGLCVNGTELVGGLNRHLSESVIVTGGLAGDGSRFERTWITHGSGPLGGQIAAVGFYGSHVRIGHGSKGGWDLFGPQRMVTRSEGNVLYELDGKPALALYKEYLGERAAGLPATALLYPLSLRAAPDAEKTLVRTVLAVDEAKQSMTFAGDVPTGHTAQLIRANFERLIEGAAHAALHTRGPALAQATPTLSIAISCVGRRLVLGERTEEELESVLDSLPEGAEQVGFYSYGEISPYSSGHCDLHNQTMTLTTFTEAM